jgi:hypothetical protein
MKGLTEEEYKTRAKLIEKIEGYCGTDNGFAELKTATLAQIVCMINALKVKE